MIQLILMLSNACKYGIRALLYLTINADESRKIGVQEIATGLEVPKAFLSKILQILSRDQILTAVKGPYGGLYLNEEQKKLPVIRIIESIDGLDSFSKCILGLPVCGTDNPCPFHFQASALRNGMLREFQTHSIDELGKRVKYGSFTI